MQHAPCGVNSEAIARQWLALADRRLLYFTGLYRSGCWTHCCTSPERFAEQMKHIRRTHPEWVIAGTPFTTVTVNNTYSTGVHKDQGDLEEGFSTLVVFREGHYEGGWLCFPEYRLGVDMQDCDLLRRRMRLCCPAAIRQRHARGMQPRAGDPSGIPSLSAEKTADE